MTRVKPTRSTETHVLLRSRRRCCICFGLNRDTSLKVGQIAHLDRNASNSIEDNLAFICLEHHDEYDSKTSQKKGFTIGEVKSFRDELVESISRAFSQQVHFGEITTPPNDPYAGKYIRIEGTVDSAEIIVTPLPDTLEGAARYFVSGVALWGLWRPSGPNLGELAFEAIVYDPGRLVFTRPSLDAIATTTLVFGTGGRLTVRESDTLVEYGGGVTFSGDYLRSDCGL